MDDGRDGNELSQGAPLFASCAVSALMFYPIALCTKLVTAGRKKTLIAQFHRAHHTIKKRKARPKVQLARIHLLDYTVLAFVIIGRGRREQAGWLLFSARFSASVNASVN